MDDSDVAGPILFFIIFGTSLLVCGPTMRYLAQANGNSYLENCTSDTSMVHSLTEAMHERAQLILYRSRCPRHDLASCNHCTHVSALVSRRASSDPRPRPRRKLAFLFLIDISSICIRTRVLPASAGSCRVHWNSCSSRRPLRIPHHESFYHLVLLLVQFDVYGRWYVPVLRETYNPYLLLLGRMTSMRGLVAYPMVLFYGSFGIMAIFSSRGTGQLAKATNSA
jgi:hypothetical protein